MIIKSMSRKMPSFDQLITYMDLGASGRVNNIYYNLYSRKAEEIEREFFQNSQLLEKRKNGVFMYHEVISITRSQQLDEAAQIEILRQTVYKYIQSRAPENLVYAVLHDDKADNLHYHLLISSNKIESSDKHRLSKAQFSTIKKSLELFVLEQHPELEQKKLISKEKKNANRENETSTLSNKEAELKRRTGKQSNKDRVIENLERIFASAKTRAQFLELLASENFQIYKRGKHWGILDEKTNRKHRFQTLGVAEAFNRLDQQLTKLENTAPQNTMKKNRVDRVANAKVTSQTAENNTTKDKKENKAEKNQTEEKQVKKEQSNKSKQAKQTQKNIDKEANKRQAEMDNIRKKKTQDKQTLKKKC